MSTPSTRAWRSMPLLAAAIAATLLSTSACVKTTTIRSASTAATPQIAEWRITGPHVPAGTKFTVRLVGPIDSGRSAVNDAFEAILTAPLRDKNGQIVALAGQHVIGRVAQLNDGRYPMILLAFDGIRTTYGFLPLSVRVDDADRTYYNAPVLNVLPPAGPTYSTAVYAPTFGAHFNAAYGDVNGGITTPESYVGHPREVRLEAGARLVLQLTRPLLLAGH